MSNRGGFIEGVIFGAILAGVSIFLAAPTSRKEIQTKLKTLRDDNEDVINDLIGYFILLKIARQRQNISNEETDYDYSELSYRSNDTISTGSLTSDLDNYNSVLYTDSHRPIHFPV